MRARSFANYQLTQSWNNSILDRKRAQTNVAELVPLELLAERSRVVADQGKTVS